MTSPGDDPNEPCDYDGYVDYVCGRSPGIDGRTLVDGTTVDTEEPQAPEMHVNVNGFLKDPPRGLR